MYDCYFRYYADYFTKFVCIFLKSSETAFFLSVDWRKYDEKNRSI